jgi:hypothetical protein
VFKVEEIDGMCTEIMDAVRQYFKSKIIYYLNIKETRHTVVVIESNCILDSLMFDSGQRKISPSAKPPGSTAETTQPPVK